MKRFKRFIGLVACGGQKRSGAHPARSLYSGTFSQRCFEWMEQNCEEWFILSALHRIVDPDEVIREYEFKLSWDSAPSWRTGVVSELTTKFSHKEQFLLIAGGYYDIHHNRIISVFRQMSRNIPNFGTVRRHKFLNDNPVLNGDVLEKIKLGKEVLSR